MHRTIIIVTILAVYYGLAVYALYLFGAGLLVTSAILYGFPAAVLAFLTHAPAPVLLSVASFGAGLAVLLEGLAHRNGLWYSLSADSSRIFGLIPLELVVATMLSTTFLALLYEALFDDRAFTVRPARQRIGFFFVFVIAAGFLVALHSWFAATPYDPYAYFFIIGSLVGATGVMVALHKELTVYFFDRLIDFGLVGAIFMGMGTWLASTNTHKVFAHPAYLDTVVFFGQTIPVEELLLMFVVPILIATMYELYLDDRT